MRASACILTRSPQAADQEVSDKRNEIKSVLPEIPVFRSFHDPNFYQVERGHLMPLNEISEFLSPPELDEIKQRRVFGFSGIARNDDFQRTVSKAGFNAVGYSDFSDHHQYSRQDLEDIVRTAQGAGADCLITTEKDHARITHQRPLSLDLIVVGVGVVFSKDGQDFISFIRSRL